METAGKGDGRVEALDGLRGIAASMVVVAHSVSALAKPTAAVFALHQSPLALISNGGGGVHLFFVLSGYVLARPASAALERAGMLPFYVRRFLRIHPPYVAGVLLSWFLSGWVYEKTINTDAHSHFMIGMRRTHISTSQLLDSLWFPGDAYLQLPVGWTLEVEAWFSILLPLLILVAARLHWLWLVAVSLPLLAIPAESRFDFLRFGLDFAFGIAIWCEREALARAFGRVPGWARGLLMTAGVALLSSPVYFMLDHREPIRSLVLYCTGATLMVMCTLHSPGIQQFLSRPLFSFVGRVSYSVYLIHAPVIILLAHYVDHQLGFFEATIFVVASLLMSYLIAPVFYLAVEAPSMRAGYRASAAIRRRLAPTRETGG